MKDMSEKEVDEYIEILKEYLSSFNDIERQHAFTRKMRADDFSNALFVAIKQQSQLFGAAAFASDDIFNALAAKILENAASEATEIKEMRCFFFAQINSPEFLNELPSTEHQTTAAKRVGEIIDKYATANNA